MSPHLLLELRYWKQETEDSEDLRPRQSIEANLDVAEADHGVRREPNWVDGIPPAQKTNAVHLILKRNAKKEAEGGALPFAGTIRIGIVSYQTEFVACLRMKPVPGIEV